MKIKTISGKFLIFIIIISTIFSSFSIAFATESTDLKFTDKVVKVGFSKRFKLDNPDEKKYTLQIANEKIAQQVGKLKIKNGKTVCKIKGVNAGSTTIKVTAKGETLGSFKVTVYKKDASLRAKKKNITLKYNSHGSSAYMKDCHIYARNFVVFPHPQAKYTAQSENYEIVNHTNDGLIYTVNKGTTSVTIYETIGSQKRSMGVVTIKVTSATMAYVAKENKRFYGEDIFGKGNKYECVYLKGKNRKFRMQSRIKECLINNIYTGSNFSKNSYEITYESLKPDVATVSKNGIVSGKKSGKTKIKYTIKFSDNSIFTGYCHISVLTKSVTT